jgi:hypothetical protein
MDSCNQSVVLHTNPKPTAKVNIQSRALGSVYPSRKLPPFWFVTGSPWRDCACGVPVAFQGRCADFQHLSLTPYDYFTERPSL